LYGILIEYGIPVKIIRLIKFPLRNGLKKKRDVLLPLLSNFALEYARVLVDQDGLI
jgi:hypothetical protein